MSRLTFLGCPMDALTRQQTLDSITRAIEENRRLQHTVVNVAKLVKLQQDSELREAVITSDIISIDGMGIVWGARWLGHPVPERVTGIDLMHDLLAWAAANNRGVYFLGATPEVLHAAVAQAEGLYPGIRIFSHHGYFTDTEHGKIIKDINKSGAKLLFIGMPTPRKEIFLKTHAQALKPLFIMGVGGSFDVLAGHLRRAPAFMQRYGLEWFYRMIQEPRRLGPRYLGTNSRYLWLLLRARFSCGKDR